MEEECNNKEEKPLYNRNLLGRKMDNYCTYSLNEFPEVILFDYVLNTL